MLREVSEHSPQGSEHHGAVPSLARGHHYPSMVGTVTFVRVQKQEPEVKFSDHTTLA